MIHQNFHYPVANYIATEMNYFFRIGREIHYSYSKKLTTKQTQSILISVIELVRLTNNN